MPKITHGLDTPTSVNSVSILLWDLFSGVIPILFALALAGFLWGASQYILKSDDETARTEGRKKMLYGIIALFVMVSFLGLVAILTNTFGINASAIPKLE